MLVANAPAPDFTLPSLHGPAVTLSELWRTNAVLLVFFKISCPTCQFTFPYLEHIHRGTPGTRLVAISQDNAANTGLFLREFGVTIPTLLDLKPDYAASTAFGISSVPTLFLIEPGGAVAWAEAGFDRARLTALGQHAGVETFAPGDRAPAFQPG